MKMISILFLLGSFSFADHHGKKKMTVEQRKARAMKNLDLRISSLQTLKSCISGASEREGIKSCRKAHRERVKSLKKNKN